MRFSCLNKYFNNRGNLKSTSSGIMRMFLFKSWLKLVKKCCLQVNDSSFDNGLFILS